MHMDKEHEQDPISEEELIELVLEAQKEALEKARQERNWPDLQENRLNRLNQNDNLLLRDSLHGSLPSHLLLVHSQ
ncbi:hypothetical protein UACE39S_06548 [Ureibacillus acetophenoni]